MKSTILFSHEIVESACELKSREFKPAREYQAQFAGHDLMTDKAKSIFTQRCSLIFTWSHIIIKNSVQFSGDILVSGFLGGGVEGRGREEPSLPIRKAGYLGGITALNTIANHF